MSYLCDRWYEYKISYDDSKCIITTPPSHISSNTYSTHLIHINDLPNSPMNPIINKDNITIDYKACYF